MIDVLNQRLLIVMQIYATSGCTLATEKNAAHSEGSDVADTDVVAPTEISVTPTSPAFDDDLICTVTDAASHTIYWEVNGRSFTGTTTSTHHPRDTVPHRAQAGGDVWRCGVPNDEATVVWSAAVTVRHPVDMVTLPPTTVNYASLLQNVYHPHRLTRPVWLGVAEVTNGEYARFLGGARAELPPESPIVDASVAEVLAFLNALSRADGLDPCFACTSDTCERPADAYACDGYRLPTELEWYVAASEAGRHEDDLPAGGNIITPPCMAEPLTCFDQFGGYPDARVGGAFAPPNSTIGDQCVYLPNAPEDRRPSRGKTKLPNQLGLYDLCGSARELLADAPNPEAELPFNDPYVSNPAASYVDDWRVAGGSAESLYAGVVVRQVQVLPSFPSINTGFRVTRTKR